jgi:hypothetical protein
MTINPTKKNILFFILYDSITNSIFDSQILAILKKNSFQSIYSQIVLISFENKSICPTIERKLFNQGIKLIVLKRKPFFGLWSLRSSVRALANILKISQPFEIIARGPHAGYVALQAIKNTPCRSITIQARGLLAEEYAYVHRNKKNPLYFLHMLRTKLFYQLEKKVYGSQSLTIPLTFQAVSPALKTYLIEEYKTNPSLITIAQEDIPKNFEAAIVQEWRTQMRKKLGIPLNSHVYCYNGSAKAWQCPDEIVRFFKQQLEFSDKAFLLLLSQDKQIFEKLLHQYHIDPSHFYVTRVPHQEIYHYLAAADTGLLFREKNIINWVSRPTKALEYQAVGLSIVHNDTIAWLQSSK